MPHLTQEEVSSLKETLWFFQQLVSLFSTNSRKEHGSVFLSQKRLTHGSDINVYTGKKNQFDILADLNLAEPLPVIVRASNGDSRDKLKSKTKISTVVQPEELDNFYGRYAEICRAGMISLKKRDRGAQKKKAKKRKVAAEGSKQP